MFIRLACLVLLVTSVDTVYAQPARIDSLSRMVDSMPDDSSKVIVLLNLSFHYIFNDSGKAWDYLVEAEGISSAKQLNYCMAQTLRVKATYYDVTGSLDSGRHYFSRAYEMGEQYGYDDVALKSLNGLGMNAWNTGAYDDALEYFFEVLSKNRTVPPDQQISESIPYNNIGLIYQERGQWDKALEYHYQALELRLANPALAVNVPTSYNNIGICLSHLGRLDDAENEYRKGIRLVREQGNVRQYYDLISNLAVTLTMKGEYDEALALELEILRNESELTLDTKMQLNTHAKVAEIYVQKNQLQKALYHVKQGLALVEQKPETEFFSSDVQRVASTVYYMLGDPVKGREYSGRMLDILQSRFSKEAVEKSAALEVKYETAMKENEILRLKAEKEEADLKIALAEIAQHRKDRVLYAVVGVALLVTVTLIARHRWRQMKWRHEEEQKIHNAIFLSEQNERVRIARDLHDSIGQKLSVQRMILSQLTEDADTKTAADIRKASVLLDETVREVRTISHNLIPQELTLGLVKAITETAERINEAGEVHVEVDCRTEVVATQKVSQNHQLSIYRIFQEILNNMLKHADATKIQISISELNNTLELLINDNGKGMTSEHISHSKGIGWKNIIARTRLISGSLRIDSNAHMGTRIKLLVPITS